MYLVAACAVGSILMANADTASAQWSALEQLCAQNPIRCQAAMQGGLYGVQRMRRPPQPLYQGGPNAIGPGPNYYNGRAFGGQWVVPRRR